MILKKITLSLIFCFSFLNLFSQDLLYKKGEKKPIEVKIIEVGLDEIKYKFFNDPESPIFTIDRNNVEKIKYKNGVEEKYKDELAMQTADFKDMHKSNLKFSFFSPFSGHSHFTYEKYIKQGISYELDASFVGLGKRQGFEVLSSNSNKFYPDNNLGLIVGGGMKFLILGNKYKRDERMVHVLQGSFIRPKVYLGNYSFTKYTEVNSMIREEKKNVTFGNIMLELGRQWIFADRLSFEVYGGLGYHISSYKLDRFEDYNFNRFNETFEASKHFIGNRINPFENTSLALNLNLKIGYVFNYKTKDSQKTKKK